MKFYRIAHQTIMSGLVVRYKELPERQNGFEVSISRDGVMLQGYSGHIKDTTCLMQLLEHGQAIYDRLRKESIFGKRTVSSDINAIPLCDEPPCVVETRKSHFGGDDVVLEVRRVPVAG